MTDDPREILRAAGVPWVGCNDFDVVAANLKPQRIVEHTREDCAMCALQRIARLVAKYKWQRDDLYEDAAITYGKTGADTLADLDRRWNELHP